MGSFGVDKAVVYRYELQGTLRHLKLGKSEQKGTGILGLEHHAPVPSPQRSPNSVYSTSAVGRGRPIVSASASLTIFPAMFNPEERSCSLEGNPVAW